jgi:hypothetical protein
MVKWSKLSPRSTATRKTTNLIVVAEKDKKPFDQFRLPFPT